MSIILECRSGDDVFCVQDFHASPDGEGFSWKTSRHFRVGEIVRYLGSRRDRHFKDGPNAWLAIIEDADGKRYAATQTHFVTEECWQGLKKFFTRKSRKKTA